MHKRKLFKPVCANVDFYSGFVYSMLGIPGRIIYSDFCDCKNFRMVCTRLEELVNAGKIIRPAYKYVDITDHTAQCRIEMKENSEIANIDKSRRRKCHSIR